jgi:hypothetical protein
MPPGGAPCRRFWLVVGTEAGLRAASTLLGRCHSRGRWTRDLAAVDLIGAAEALGKIEAFYPDRKGLAGRRTGLSYLRALMDLPAGLRTERLAELVHGWRGESDLKGLHANPQVTERCLWTALRAELAPGRTAPLANGLLPAEVAVRLEDWEAAGDGIAASLRDLGEHAYLRQLRAWVLHKQGRNGSARDSLSLALFHDAASCQAKFLFDDLAALFSEIRATTTDDSAAWQRLTFRAWQEELLAVSPANPAYETFLARSLDTESADPDDLAVRGQRFLRLLFLAEATRLRQAPVSDLLPWRESMRQLLPDRFREYMAMIA